MHPCYQNLQPGDKVIVRRGPYPESEEERTWLVTSAPMQFEYDKINYVTVVSRFPHGEGCLYLTKDRFEKIIKKI